MLLAQCSSRWLPSLWLIWKSSILQPGYCRNHLVCFHLSRKEYLFQKSFRMLFRIYHQDNTSLIIVVGFWLAHCGCCPPCCCGDCFVSPSTGLPSSE